MEVKGQEAHCVNVRHHHILDPKASIKAIYPTARFLIPLLRHTQPGAAQTHLGLCNRVRNKPGVYLINKQRQATLSKHIYG